MTAGSYIIGLGGGFACLGIAWAIGRAIARVEFAIDETFGDVPHLNGEFADARISRAGSEQADAGNTQHNSGPLTTARGLRR